MTERERRTTACGYCGATVKVDENGAAARHYRRHRVTGARVKCEGSRVFMLESIDAAGETERETPAPNEWRRVASGDYETRDGRFRLWRVPDVYPPAWNVERLADGALLADGARTMRDAIALAAGEPERVPAPEMRARRSAARAAILTPARLERMTFEQVHAAIGAARTEAELAPIGEFVSELLRANETAPDTAVPDEVSRALARIRALRDAVDGARLALAPSPYDAEPMRRAKAVAARRSAARAALIAADHSDALAVDAARNPAGERVRRRAVFALRVDALRRAPILPETAGEFGRHAGSIVSLLALALARTVDGAARGDARELRRAAGALGAARGNLALADTAARDALADAWRAIADARRAMPAEAERRRAERMRLYGRTEREANAGETPESVEAEAERDETTTAGEAPAGMEAEL